MSTNKLFVLTAACILSGAFCALSAMADVSKPESYKRLTAVNAAPPQVPSLSDGPYRLSSRERRFNERLPLQLSGPVKKVSATKYKPQKRQPVKKQGSRY